MTATVTLNSETGLELPDLDNPEKKFSDLATLDDDDFPCDVSIVYLHFPPPSLRSKVI